MKIRVFVSAVVMGLGLAVSAAACPLCSKSADSARAPRGKTVQAADLKAPCGAGAVTVAAKVDEGRSETTAKSGCGKNCTKGCCKKGAKTASGKSPCPCPFSAKTASADAGCPIAKKVEAVLASMPAMKYRVGDEVTGCSESAAAMAKKLGKPLKYVVGDDVLDTEGDAISKLTALLEKEAEVMQSIQFVAGGKCGRCPMTAKNAAKESGTVVTFRVGGVDFKNRADADKSAKLVSDAVAKLAMTYKVDGKSFGCGATAGAKCKETGAKLTYVIGDKETCCKTSAALMLAQAKVRKIVEIAAAASFSL